MLFWSPAQVLTLDISVDHSFPCPTLPAFTGAGKVRSSGVNRRSRARGTWPAGSAWKIERMRTPDSRTDVWIIECCVIYSLGLIIHIKHKNTLLIYMTYHDIHCWHERSWHDHIVECKQYVIQVLPCNTSHTPLNVLSTTCLGNSFWILCRNMKKNSMQQAG